MTLVWTCRLPDSEALPQLWEVGECEAAFLVQSVEVCKYCGKHKVVGWIGKASPKAAEVARERADQLNQERRDPATQVDARPSGTGCDHRNGMFRWYRAGTA